MKLNENMKMNYSSVANVGPFSMAFSQTNLGQRKEFRLMINLTMVINITFAWNLFVLCTKKQRILQLL